MQRPLLLLFCLLFACLYQYIHAQVVLNGAGTAPALLVHNMLLSFYGTDDGTTINYQESLYPAPKDLFLANKADFFVAIQALSDTEHTPGACCQCDDIRAIPIVVSGWAFIHNLGGAFGQSPVIQLNLTRDQLVGIYLGNFTNWSQINSAYPNQAIKVAYQNCSGGTDTITTAFAAMSSAWPASNVCPNTVFPVGVGFTAHEEVLQYVASTPYSIGYMSYSTYKFAVKEPAFTNQLVGIQNKAGNTILPTTANFYSASVDFADSVSESILGVVGDIVDGPGATSWPFTYYEYVTMRSRSNDCAKLDKLFRFIIWVISAREVLSLQLGPSGISILPPETNNKVLAMLDNFVCCTRQTINQVITQGTIFGHTTFIGLSSARIYGYTPLNDTITSSSDAITQVTAGNIDAALSTIYPPDSPNLLTIRLYGAAVVCAANLGNRNSPFILDNVTLAAIFEKTTTTWNDPAILALNTNNNNQLSGTITLLNFPDADTSGIVSAALKSFSASFTGKNLPAASGQASSQDILNSISSTTGSIGCFEYSTDLVASSTTTYISLKNAAGNVIAAPPEVSNIFSAMNDFAATPNALLVNGHGATTWPICAYDYLVLNVDVNAGRCAQITALAQLVVWVFTTSEAQATITSDGLSYPPSSVRAAEQGKFVGLTCNNVALTPYVEDLYGVGASFPLLVYQSWPLFFATLPDPVTHSASVTVRVSYAITGSDNGVEYFNSNLGEIFAEKSLAHFGATDISSPAPPSLSKFPTLAGGLALIVNFMGSGYTQVVLTRSAIVQIYTGVITMWNDAKIAASNTGVTLPNARIILVLRSHESGSTYILKKALQSFSSSDAPWTGDVNPTSTWPYNATAIYADNSYDVTAIVDTTFNTLGYVEHSYAIFTGLLTCSIINKNGNTTLPTPDTITSAMNDFPLSENNLVTDLVDGPGANSYPLASYTYVLVNRTFSDCATSARVLTFLDWSMNATDPRARALSFGLVPLPPATISLVEDELRTLTCNGAHAAIPSIAIGCDNITGSGQVYDACGECNGNNDTCCLGTPEQIAKYCFHCDYYHDRPPYLLLTYKCDGFLDCTGAEDDLHCDVSIVKTSITLSAIAGVCIILCFMVGADLLVHRNETVFRESNVFFMMMILSGVVVGYSAIFVFSQLTKLNNFVCGVQYWFFSVAFVLTFGSMIAKTFQVYMLHRQHSGDLSAYTNQAIVRYVAAALLIEIILLIIWTAFDRPIPVLRHNDPAEDSKEHLICGNKHFTVFAVLLALFFGLIMVAGVVLTFLSRDIDFEGNESRLIRRTILSAALLAIVILPILIALGSSFPFVRILLSNVALLLIASLIMITYFGPKLAQFHFGGEGAYSDVKGKKRLIGPIEI